MISISLLLRISDSITIGWSRDLFWRAGEIAQVEVVLCHPNAISSKTSFSRKLLSQAGLFPKEALPVNHPDQLMS